MSVRPSVPASLVAVLTWIVLLAATVGLSVGTRPAHGTSILESETIDLAAEVPVVEMGIRALDWLVIADEAEITDPVEDDDADCTEVDASPPPFAHRGPVAAAFPCPLLARGVRPLIWPPQKVRSTQLELAFAARGPPVTVRA
ncbi:MAG: hypothetical protein KC656_19190 [Myxococcales bacterium]|nr:hypothetical protein [Myxococcales bacterium]MCB9669798.1 hypothetical protein [Alphaproteobacteria bacterium]